MTEPPQSWGTAPPPSQPSWRQPGGVPTYDSTPVPGRNKLPWIMGAAAVVLVIAIVGLVLVLRSPGSGGPEATATSFIEAAKDGNCEAFTRLTTEHFQETYGRCEGDVDTTAFLGAAGVTIDEDVAITERGDDTATAEVDVSAAGFSVPLQLLLVREGELWLVDAVTIAGFGLDDIPSIPPDQLPD
jgi:hypothetical protein